MEQKLVCFIISGFTVVPRDCHCDVRRDQSSLNALQPRQQLLSHLNGIGTGTFGNGDADCRNAVPVAIFLRRVHPHAVF